jgi:polyisoprenoid-binding protein YceI
MKTRYSVLAAVLAAASPALAAETYQFDKAHTTVGFQVRHIEVDRAKPESSSVEFTIQAKSIDTNEPKRDAHLRSADFFDVQNQPTISFKSTSVKANGKDSWLVSGNLTMHGVTKPVTLPVAFLGEGKDPWGNEKMGFEVSLTLNRTDYGLNWNKALDTGGFLLGDEVKVEIAVEANKAKAPAATK